MRPRLRNRQSSKSTLLVVLACILLAALATRCSFGAGFAHHVLDLHGFAAFAFAFIGSFHEGEDLEGFLR